MTFPKDQIDELKELCEELAAGEEGGVTYLLLRGARMPAGCSPAVMDALLCPSHKDGYDTRLFYSAKPTLGAGLNWNAQVRILDRQWCAYSWKVPNGLTLRLAQMFIAHVRALR